MECDYCFVQEAELEIVLTEGQVFYSCQTCVFDVIKEQADTDNRVATMTEIEA